MIRDAMRLWIETVLEDGLLVPEPRYKRATAASSSCASLARSTAAW